MTLTYVNNMATVIFYILATIILVFSVLSVTSKVILRAAIYLLFVLCATAGMYFIFEYNFLAAVQLTVYAGGIVVLVIFSILVTSSIGEKLEAPGLQKSLFAGLAAFAGAILSISVIAQQEFPAPMLNEVMARTDDSSVRTIGHQLLTFEGKGYVLPFEVISVLLLAALIAAIVVAKRDKSISKTEEKS